MILSAERIVVTFDGFRAVDDASLAVEEGAIAGLVGPNGAGKSSLFGAIAGSLRATSGRVVLEGHDISRDPDFMRARRGLARTFQVPREFSHLTVVENLSAAVPGQAGERLGSLFFRPGAVRADERRVAERVAEVIEVVGLRAVADLAAGRLSGGQRKLLELGRALLTEPRILLLDEPFGGVNPVLIEQLIGILRGLSARGITLLVVEHNLGALSQLADTLHVMDRGRIIASGPPAEVLADPEVQSAYLGTIAP